LELIDCPALDGGRGRSNCRSRLRLLLTSTSYHPGGSLMDLIVCRWWCWRCTWCHSKITEATC